MLHRLCSIGFVALSVLLVIGLGCSKGPPEVKTPAEKPPAEKRAAEKPQPPSPDTEVALADLPEFVDPPQPKSAPVPKGRGAGGALAKVVKRMAKEPARPGGGGGGLADLAGRFTGLFGGAAPTEKPAAAGWAEVSGQVTIDGKPLPDGTITFRPGDAGTVVQGRISEGTFKIDRTSGLRPGPYRIEISSLPPGVEPGKPEVVPRRYNVASELRREMQQGANMLQFELTTQ